MGDSGCAGGLPDLNRRACIGCVSLLDGGQQPDQPCVSAQLGVSSDEMPATCEGQAGRKFIAIALRDDVDGRGTDHQGPNRQAKCARCAAERQEIGSG